MAINDCYQVPQSISAAIKAGRVDGPSLIAGLCLAWHRIRSWPRSLPERLNLKTELFAEFVDSLFVDEEAFFEPHKSPKSTITVGRKLQSELFEPTCKLKVYNHAGWL